MSSKKKTRLSDECPCYSGKIYENCCLGKVDWDSLIAEKSNSWIEHTSIRGRNLMFYYGICHILGLDKEPSKITLKTLKAAITPNTVREIHESLIGLWPRDINIAKVLSHTQTEVSGLYIGLYYNPIDIMQGVIRHSVYANKIILIDPFTYPYSVNEEYNPIINPKQYLSLTLKNIHIWTQFMPWVKAGLVEFIRTPGDFDIKLNWESLKMQESKFATNLELQKIMDKTARELMERSFHQGEMERMLMFSQSDDNIRKMYSNFKRENPDEDVLTSEDKFLNYIHKMRDNDPYFVQRPEDDKTPYYSLHQVSSGANYTMAKIISELTGSYFVTDIPTKWKEIEIDREGKDSSDVWTPLGKAFQELDIKYLDNIDLEGALMIRKQNRLSNLRSFMNKMWKDASSGNPFSQENVIHLADELKMRVNEAEEEWKEIDRELKNWSIGSIVASAPAIGTGNAFFLPAIGIATAAKLWTAQGRRKGFPDRFPAAFFMNLKK